MDKPWKTRYVENPKANFNVSETLYKTYVNVANAHLNDIAVSIAQTGERYTYGKLSEMIDRAGRGLYKYGIRENTKVGIFLNGSVEEAVVLLALNKIGAISKYIDYAKSISAMMHSMEESNVEVLIADECFLPLIEIINLKELPVIVANTNKKYCDCMLSFNEILEMGKEGEDFTATYKDGKPAVIINSSGTTGESKPIVHTNFSINAAAQKMLYTDYPLSKGNVLIKMVPSQIGLGLITSLYTGLLSGVEVVLLSGKNVLELTKNMISFILDFGKYMEKNSLGKSAKLNLFTSPLFIRELISSPEIENLSFIGSLLAAGSKMEKIEFENLNAKALEKGCHVPICNGYGQNELAGAATLNCVHYNVNGSAGFPTKGTDIIVVNQDTYEILKPNEVGLILESSNSMFLCYENLDEKTQASFIKFADGSQWFNSCDLGYMDEAGFLFITGRMNRVAIKSDAKISLDDLEGRVKALSFISDCAVIVREHGKSEDDIVAFVVSDIYDKNLILQMIVDSSILSNFEIPSEIVVVEKISYKNNGKIDYSELEKRVAMLNS